MFDSVPIRTSMPSSRSLSSRTRSIWRRSSSGETSLPNPCDAEWSVIAMYERPRSRQASAPHDPPARPPRPRAPRPAAAPAPYPALPLARALDPRLVVESDAPSLAGAIRAALDDPAPDYAARALDALPPVRGAAGDRTVAEALLPRLLASG